MTSVPLHLIEFGKKDIGNTLAALRPDEIDKLAFGAIQLDAVGRVVSYNVTESQITGRKREDVVGKLFFTEVAPCTNRLQFRGEFEQIVAGKKDAVLFEYVFDYKMNPTRVKVHMKRAIVGDNFWVLVSRL